MKSEDRLPDQGQRSNEGTGAAEPPAIDALESRLLLSALVLSAQDLPDIDEASASLISASQADLASDGGGSTGSEVSLLELSQPIETQTSAQPARATTDYWDDGWEDDYYYDDG